MGKKIFLFTLMILLALGLVKVLFFSGIYQTAATPSSFREAEEPGFVWARAGVHYSRGRLGEFLLGQHYRPVWKTPVKVPVLNIDQTNGGLQINKMGGGQQTTSLSLKAANGQTWVLRSLDKDPVNALPPFWHRSILVNLVRDQISASHPYAALVVSGLAEAAGIFHANPKVVFVAASDSHFSAYQTQMGNKLFLLEEKYDNPPHVWPQLKGVSALLDSRKMLDNRFRYQAHRIDEKAFALCRLFDLLIGDWDRHEGQWSWAAYTSDSAVYYKPIPKDRDQAFSRYQDGFIPWVLTRDFALPKFGHFNNQMTDVGDYTINASFIDERALNAVTLPEFKALAHQLKARLTDSVITAAVKLLPSAIYQISGPELTSKLKGRRQTLEQIATDYYQVLARQVVVPGTDQREKFEVNRLPNGQVLVKVSTLNAGKQAGNLLYQRLFLDSETKEITLHGLGGADNFVVTGKVSRSIKINIVGGRGKDNIADYSEVAEGGKATIVFDTQEGNKITWGPNTEDRTTNNLSVHHFDREGL